MKPVLPSITLAARGQKSVSRPTGLGRIARLGGLRGYPRNFWIYSGRRLTAHIFPELRLTEPVV